MVLYPAAIMVAFTTSIIAMWLIRGFNQTVEIFQPPITCETSQSDPSSGPDIATFEDHHEIALTAVVYDESTDTTTVTYTVTSGPKPSISHWLLGLPMGIQPDFIEASEQYEWMPNGDPSISSNPVGIKFDTGYEVADNGGGDPPGKGKNKKELNVSDDEIDTVSRDVVLHFQGQYDFGSVQVYIKAGQTTYNTVIIAPIGPTSQEECE
jgi:hypothetical protein